VARITRKELKSDKFALEVEQTFSFFEEHQKEIIRYGGIALAVVALILAYMGYQRHQKAAREEALARAIQVQEGSVGPASTNNPNVFPTQDAKDQAAMKAFTGIMAQYSGSREAEIAQYYFASVKADQGKWAEAEKGFQDVVQNADANYSSLAKLSLAQVYFAEGKDSQGETLLHQLIDHPTMLVSKDQAIVSLAQHLAPKNPAEARKLLDPLKGKTGPVGQMVLTIWSQLPTQ
jgi:predicted negative regulator of RcsB-dependent stress response